MFGDNIHESKLEAVMAIAALLQGPYEVGNNILAREGVVEIMLAMADSGSAIYTVTWRTIFTHSVLMTSTLVFIFYSIVSLKHLHDIS